MASQDTQHADLSPVVLAIDPGSNKCGVAVVSQTGEARFQGVIETDQASERIRLLVESHHPLSIVVGNGTGSRPLLQQLRAADLQTTILSVDESHTSEEARARFVRENSARGWQRILPRALRTPWRAYDDYVALILGERYWRGKVNENDQI